MKYKPVFFICLALGAGIWASAQTPPDAPAAAAEDKPPDVWTLPVKLVPQETELWCWAATGQMTMGYFGMEVSQSDQANLLFRRRDCGQRPVPRECTQGGRMVLNEYGYTYNLLRKPVIPDEIVRQTYTLRKPMPFAWLFTGGGGHAALVVGYNKQTEGQFLVECFDPWPPPHTDQRDWAGGQRLFMPYSRWCEDYDHSFGQVLINVAKGE